MQFLDLLGCKLLNELPSGLGHLVNLRHLAIDKFIHIPARVIGQLSSLQTLPLLWVSKGGFQLEELGFLHHVTKGVFLAGLDLIKSKRDAEAANLSEKTRVDELLLWWETNDN